MFCRGLSARRLGQCFAGVVRLHAWGNVLPGSFGSAPNPFKWNAAGGYQHIPFTGLYHVGAREYDPRTARWLQRDPIGPSSGDPNVYRYCGNNPINEDDPSGFGPEWWRRVKTWYMGGMGGLSDWVDEKITGGATKNLGTTVGNYDCGTASGWEIAGAAAILGIEVADTATGGKKKLIKNAVQEGAEQTGKKKAKDVAADALADKLAKVVWSKIPKPAVQHPKLQNIMNQLYRSGGNVGNGSTADAIRKELATGELVGGKSHLQKGGDYVRSLTNWLNNNPDGDRRDIDAAKAVLNDLANALKGK